MSLVGNIFMLALFTLVGPLAFIGLDKNIDVTVGSLTFMGIGEALLILSTYSRAQIAAMRAGFPRDVKTQHFISGKFFISFNTTV